MGMIAQQGMHEIDAKTVDRGAHKKYIKRISVDFIEATVNNHESLAEAVLNKKYYKRFISFVRSQFQTIATATEL